MRHKLSYELIGSSKNDIIMFLHGIGTASWSWWYQVADLNENYSILLVDLPGHGESMNIPWENMEKTVDLVAEVIPKDRKVHVVGLSLGGHVALDLAKKYPKNLKSVYISGITTRPMGPKFLKLFLPLYLKQLSSLQHNEIKMKKLFIQMGIPHDKIALSITDYQKVSMATYTAIFNELYSFEMDYSYKKVNLPIMFVACEHEERGIKQTLKYAPTIIKQAKTTFIKDARHQWSIQKPDIFNNEVKQWLSYVSSIVE